MGLYLALLWAVIFGLVAVSSLFTVWARRQTHIRGIAVILFLSSFVVTPVVYTETLGMHKPFGLAWNFPDGDHRVIGTKLVQDGGIYLYLDTGRTEPWPLVLPWDNEMANRIQGLMDNSRPEDRGQFMMQFEHSWDTNAPQFHPLPQPPALPRKPAQPRAPHLEGDA